jgi:hypothetical protein
MAEPTYIINYCTNCRGLRNSKELFYHRYQGEDDFFSWHERFYIVECAGCGQPCFRYEYSDDSMIWQDDNGTLDHYYEIRNFPPHLGNGYIPLIQTHLLPTRIRTVYNETIEAMKVKSYLLAAVGFRTIIEAICIENDIKGHNLETKIKNLAKNKLITEKEEKRLHSIRFLGNDSVHEMIVPKQRTLFLVLEIVEHLLKNLYIIDLESASLDTPIQNIEDFERLVFAMVKTFEDGQEKTMREILGKHIRRVGNELPMLETQLIKLVNEGKSQTVKLGRVETTQGKAMQYYLRGDDEEFQIPDFDPEDAI